MLFGPGLVVDPINAGNIPRAIYANFPHNRTLAGLQSTSSRGGLQGIQWRRKATQYRSCASPSGGYLVSEFRLCLRGAELVHDFAVWYPRQVVAHTRESQPTLDQSVPRIQLVWFERPGCTQSVARDEIAGAQTIILSAVAWNCEAPAQDPAAYPKKGTFRHRNIWTISIVHECKR